MSLTITIMNSPCMKTDISTMWSAELRAKGYVYEQDNAVWFKTTAFGQEQDRVIIKSSGEPTYRLPDMAYHRENFAEILTG